MKGGYNRGEMYYASLILTEIGRYGFSDETKRYIIAKITKSLNDPAKEEKNPSDEDKNS